MGFERGMGRRRRRRRTIVEGSGKVVMERERLTERPMREEKRKEGFGHETGKLALTCGAMPNTI